MASVYTSDNFTTVRTLLQIYVCKLYETFSYICQYYLAAMSGWKLLNQLVENICLQT